MTKEHKPISREANWKGETQPAPWNKSDSESLLPPYPAVGKHHFSEKLLLLMSNTDTSLRKQWQKSKWFSTNA